MARTTTARHLRPGDQFIDPHRTGRRRATVVDITTHRGQLHLTLDDHTHHGPWAATYHPDEPIELA